MRGQDQFQLNLEETCVQGIPILHYNMEFACFVAKVLHDFKPDCIAIELPRSVQKAVMQGISRLPYLSIVTYPTRQGDKIFLPIEPCDGMIEALRYASENKVESAFVDMDVDEYPTIREYLPDTCSLNGLSGFQYAQISSQFLQGETPRGEGVFELERRRERFMAYQIQQIASKGFRRIAFVCGMSHWKRVSEDLLKPQVLPLGFFRRQNAQVFALSEESSRSCLGETGFISAAYEVFRNLGQEDPTNNQITKKPGKSDNSSNQSLKLADTQSKDEDELFTDVSQSGIPGPSLANPGQPRFQLGVIQGKAKKQSKESSLQELFDEMKYHLKDFLAKLPLNSLGVLDRVEVLRELGRLAANLYEERTQDQVKSWQKRSMRRFLARYCKLEGSLCPDFFQIINASKGIVDDDFAYCLWELGSSYPWQQEKPDLAEVNVTPQEVWLGEQKIAFRRKIQSRKNRPLAIPSRLRPRETTKGEWKEDFKRDGLCSYPMEDIAIENFAGNLKQKGAQILSSQHCRVQKFSTSLLDGIDFRETIRNYQDSTIYVKELRDFRSEIGSVVMIFDEDEGDERYPYKLTWLGEHDQESDLSFYATHYKDQLIGPGIGRSTYGGFLMIYPPQRLYDVWTDPNYLFLPKKSEKLLAAGLEYSIEKHIVYIAPKPPRQVFHELARRMGRKIIFVSLGSFSPHSLKKIRRFHVLSGQDKREIIQDYL